MEDYAAKMALKTEVALREYVTGYAQYREEAVLAALDELRRRGQPAPEEATLRPQLEVVVQQARAAEAARQAAMPPTLLQPEAPVLYTPGVIVLFSVLFSTITGAVLLALNLHQLKRTRAIWGLAGFVLAYLVGELLVLGQLARHGSFSPLVASLLNLPLIMAYVFWFWPRYVATYQFRPRGWLRPLLICFVLVAILNVWLLRLLHQSPEWAALLKQLQH
ncbi:MAG: hypothetical protein ACRYFX_13820 [Janthinobacterium lividum]